MRQKSCTLIVNIYRTIICVVAISLVTASFSARAVVYQHVNDQPTPNDNGIDSVSLSRLYQNPSDYLWMEQKKLTARAYDALEFIAGSVNHGLNPNDYHQNLLTQLEPTQDESEAHLFDLMLSDGLLKLVRDISTGRLDPTIVDPKWSIPRSSFDATVFLQRALSGNRLKEALRALVPTSMQYQQLKAAARRYQDFVDRGGWPKISGVTELRIGESHQSLPIIRKRLAIENKALKLSNAEPEHLYDKKLGQAVKQFQRRHSLKTDGIIGTETLRAMNVTAEERLQQININLERLRWLPDNLGERYIMVNLANYRLTAVEDGEVKLDMRVIVGKTKRPTPSFRSQMTYIVFNPKWYVPNKLARLDLLPKQQNNPDFFSRSNIRVYDYIEGKKTELDPHSIDWNSLSENHFPYSLVQDPGKKNALGRLKFILPNPWSIYLHDTPSKYLFSQNERNFSSGCIRVEDPFALAEFSLGGADAIPTIANNSDENVSYRTKLNHPLSVYAIYSTVWPDGNEIIFSPDSYQRDQQMAKYL